MTKNLIKKLAEASYTKNELDERKVRKISKSLRRPDLKIYIKGLKTIEKKKTVTVSVPRDEGIREMRTYFSKIYPDKRLVFNVDESLITGVKVVDYDNVYELSLKSFLDQAVKNTND